MANKDVLDNWEKEAIRRHLLASTISSIDTGGLKGSHRHLAGFWQRLFKRSRMHQEDPVRLENNGQA